MGMFDSVVFKCPKCESEIEIQSKSGDCTLNVYGSDRIPADVLAGLTIYDSCYNCGTEFKLSNPTSVIVPVEFFSVKLEEVK